MSDYFRFKVDPKPWRLLLIICLRDPKICWRTDERLWRLQRLDPCPGTRTFLLHRRESRGSRSVPRGRLDPLPCLPSDQWLLLLHVSHGLEETLSTHQRLVDLDLLRPLPLRRVQLLGRLYLPARLLDRSYQAFLDLLCKHRRHAYRRCRILSHLRQELR